MFTLFQYAHNVGETWLINMVIRPMVPRESAPTSAHSPGNSLTLSLTTTLSLKDLSGWSCVGGNLPSWDCSEFGNCLGGGLSKEDLSERNLKLEEIVQGGVSNHQLHKHTHKRNVSKQMQHGIKFWSYF